MYYEKSKKNKRQTRIVAKINYSALRVKTLLEKFPDALFIYIIRSPLETMSSHLSLHRNIFDHAWGLNSIPQESLKRYFKIRYEYNVALYRYFYDLQKNNEFSDEQLLEISYNSLRYDLKEALAQVKAFTDIEISEALQKKLDAQCEKQKSYQREHKNLSFEQFGLTEKKIREDLSFIFEKYRKEGIK